jgi:hypothetical protein
MRTTRVGALLLLAGLVLTAHTGAAQDPYKPTVGQPGRDAVWVPTTEAMVERMLDHAKVTPNDFVMDLGSGDGRMIIAAAKRGARGLGVEFTPELVEFSKRRAAEKATARAGARRSCSSFPRACREAGGSLTARSR